jgi:alpha-beta hydrolase superfamily lysophospholipase
MHHWQPVTSERAVLLIAHGMAEHADRYAPLAQFLGVRGFHVHAIDHRGHGRSATNADDLGHFSDSDGWLKVIGDLQTAVTHVRNLHPGLPVVLLGHSMGSFISQAWAIEHGKGVDALVLSGSNHGSILLYRIAGLVARLEKFRQGARGKSALLEFLSFGAFNNAFKPARTDYDWLSRDEAQVDLYVKDPLCGFRVSNQLWIDLLGGLVEITKVKNLARIPHELPVYLLAGDQDPVGQAGKGVEKLAVKLREAGIRDVSVMLYREGRHEMFNETNRAEVFGDLAQWLKTHLKNG